MRTLELWQQSEGASPLIIVDRHDMLGVHRGRSQVVVGKWEKGSQGMRKNSNLPGEQHVTYTSFVDAVANPAIFVVTQSTQAYPAYIITYRP